MNLTRQQQIDKLHLDIAATYAQQSKAVRNKVGAIIVTKSGVIVPGYNGTPSGWNNVCEYKENGVLVTKPEVIHAELNAILKCAREGISTLDATLYITLSPCIPCSAMIANSGITRTVYKDQYRILDGVISLMKHNHDVVYFGE